jgi:hypothetical protein
MAREEIRLVLNGLEIRVRSDNPSDLAWVADFFSPGLCVDKSDRTPSVTRSLELSGNADTYNSVIAEFASARARAAAYVLDAGAKELPCISLPDCDLIAHDPLFGTIYEIVNRDTVVIRDSGTRDSEGRRARASFMLIINAFVMDYARRTGACVMHAAGVVHRGKAWLIAGEKNSGKTSLLSALLGAVQGLQLLSNDRILIWPNRNPLLARGLSCLVSIRAGTLDVVPGLRDKLSLVPRNYTGELWPAERLRDPYRLTPLQFRQMLGVIPAASAPIGGIFLTSVRKDVTGVKTRRLCETEARQKMPVALYGHHDLSARTELFSLPESGVFPEPTETLSSLRAITAKTPVFEVLLGAGAYETSSLEDFIGATAG